jgi:acetyl esterase
MVNVTMRLLHGIEDIKDKEVLSILGQVDPRGGTAPFTPEEKRASYRLGVVRGGPPEPVADIRDERTPEGVALRTYVPAVSRAGAARVLYLHGGGFLSGDFATHDPICRLLANGAGVCVTAVEYRLAPEAPFPAAVDDCWSVLQWLTRSDSSRVVVMGDSAGGNLAAVLALKARYAKIQVAAQVLIYPMLDALLASPSMVENALVPPFTLLDCLRAWQWYLGSPDVDRRSPEVSPLYAPDLRGVAPALIITAGFDILRDEGTRYAQRLREAEVAVEQEHFPEMVHGFLQWTGQVPTSRACLHRIVRFLATE